MKTHTNRISRVLLSLSMLAALTLGATTPSVSVRVASFTVTKTADTNDGTCDADCSLREAIIAANVAAGANTITIPAGIYTLTITGTDEDAAATGDLDLSSDITIIGAGAESTVIQAAPPRERCQ